MKNKDKYAVLKNGCSWLAASGAVFTAISTVPNRASAHGFEGDYFFPPTIITDDPFAVDEFPFPTVSWFKTDGVSTTDIAWEFDKEIFPKFALSYASDYMFNEPDGQRGTSGLDETTVGWKYQLWENPEHQAIFSVGTLWEIRGSGSSEVISPSTHVFTPTVYYGKAFGDLPDSLNYMKPLAITGTLGEDLPTRAVPNNLEWGFAVEYSLLYLQEQVKDIGLPAPFKTMIPLVEFSLKSPENRGGGETTGTICPGVLYENPDFQIGAEALIPVNGATGPHVGFVIQFELFIDDVLPKIFGHTLFFGGRSVNAGAP
jgi:hypothetical protein